MVYGMLLAAHLAISWLVWRGIQLHILNVRPYMVFVVALLPFWGVLLVLILHFRIFLRVDNSAALELEKVELESELYRSITIEDKSVSAHAVPIEEALLVNSARERRQIIMDVLNDNPADYIQFLQKAGNNEDTEVVHYAVTAMVEISKENDFRLQEFERQHAKDPDDVTILTEYTDFLWNCLSQNLMQGQVVLMNRALFSDLMQKKMALLPGSVSDFQRVVENELRRESYGLASAMLKKMQEQYPDSEAYYLSRLSYLAALGRGGDIQQLVQEVRNKQIFLSSAAKEVLAFWES